MRYVLPALLFALLALIVIVTPHLEPRRLRAVARQVGEQLRADYGFHDGSKASWVQTRSGGRPPFHYGTHRATDGELLGMITGLTVRAAGYECVDNGARHRYGLACVLLPEARGLLEMRGEPVHATFLVPEQVPDGRMELGRPEFDARYQVYTTQPAPAGLTGPGRVRSTQLMLAVPICFSWRVEERELLVWKRNGWPDAGYLVEAVNAALGVLGLQRAPGAWARAA
jgi:hypothetical protein